MTAVRSKNRSLLISLSALALAASGTAVLSRAQSALRAQVRFPAPDIGVDSLPELKKAQNETVGQFKVFYQFQFSDRRKESGITFDHRAVDDVTRRRKTGSAAWTCW